MPRDSQAQKQQRAALAQETQSIVATGGYRTVDGFDVDVSAEITACRTKSQFVAASRPMMPFAWYPQPHVSYEIADEGTLAAAKRLHDRGLSVAALNFASYRRPGGGWLSGANAQEESLARCSALHAALTAPGPCAAHYQKRNDHNPLYSHDMIYSPAVPVLRNEAGELVRPWPLAFISAAAPNAGVARKDGVAEREIEAALAERAERVLALAARGGHDAVVLGAWGCGVFQNHTDTVAKVWAALLAGRYRGAFKVVAFPLKGFKRDDIAAFEALLRAAPTPLPVASLPAASPAGLPGSAGASQASASSASSASPAPAASPASADVYSRSPASFGGKPPFNVRRGTRLEETAVDLSGVEARLREASPAPGSKLAVLTLSGSLSPVHTGHVAMMEAAAAALKAAGVTVVFGWLVPSSESYVNSKLGAEALSLRERCELAAAAVRESPWLEALGWGVASSEAIARGAAGVCARAFPAFGWEAYQVVGADFALKANLEGRAGKNGNRYVCLRRGGLGEAQAARQAAWASSGRRRVDFVVAEAPLHDASSTRVRQMAADGRWAELAASGMLHRDVASVLRERGWLGRNVVNV